MKNKILQHVIGLIKVQEKDETILFNKAFLFK